MELEGFFSVAKNFFLRKHLSFINNYKKKKKNYDDASISFVLTEMHCRSWYVVEIGIFRGKSRTPWWHFINHSWLRYSQSKVKLFYCFGTNHETNVKKRDPLLSIPKKKREKKRKREDSIVSIFENDFFSSQWKKLFSLSSTNSIKNQNTSPVHFSCACPRAIIRYTSHLLT